MSWVLILTSPVYARPPAVIGGYETLEAAEAAGIAATSSNESDRQFYAFTVIAGAAASGPTQAVYSHVTREWYPDGAKLNRVTRRWPE